MGISNDYVIRLYSYLESSRKYNKLAIPQNNKFLLINPNRFLSPISNFYFPTQEFVDFDNLL